MVVPVVEPVLPLRPELGTTESAEPAVPGRSGAESGAGGLWAVDHLYWPVAPAREPDLGRRGRHRHLPSRHRYVRLAATDAQPAGGGQAGGGASSCSRAAASSSGWASAAIPRSTTAAGVDFHPARRPPRRRPRVSCAGPGGLDAPVGYRQEPVPSPVPVWIGGSAAAAIARAGRAGDGWVPLFLSPAAYARGLAGVAEAAERAGRRADDVLAAVVVMVSIGPDAQAEGLAWLSSLYGLPAKAFEGHLVAGSAAQVAAALGRYRDVGARHVVAMVAADRALEQFAALADAFGAPAGHPMSPAAVRPDPVEVVSV